MKIVTKTVNFVEYYDLEEFICETYGLCDLSIPEILEASNDTSRQVTVNAGSLDGREIDTLQKFIDFEGRKSCSLYSLSTVLKDLCNKGLIPAGEYVINISW